MLLQHRSTTNGVYFRIMIEIVSNLKNYYFVKDTLFQLNIIDISPTIVSCFHRCHESHWVFLAFLLSVFFLESI